MAAWPPASAGAGTGVGNPRSHRPLRYHWVVPSQHTALATQCREGSTSASRIRCLEYRVVVESQRGDRRRRKWLIASAVVAILVIWLVLLGLRSMSAYRHDKNGLALLEQVKSNLSPDDLTSSGSERLLDQADAQFTSAQSELSSPLFGPITIVPVIGRQLRSVRALSTAAGTVSAVGSSFLSRVHTVINQPHSAGPERVASIRTLATVSGASASRLHDIDTGPSQGLVAPLASKYNQFISQLDDAQGRLTKAAAVSAAVATILQGPETYLVLASNNAEMRAGSGAFLDVGAAMTADGAVHLGTFGPSGDLPLTEGEVAVTGDLQRNWGWLHPSLDFRNLGLTPQFDVTAPLAARMWTARTGQPVDGVIALDVAGLRQLLVATGPVQVGGTTVSADNVEQYLLHDQYDGLTYTSPASSDREDALGGLARAVLSQLQGQSTDLKSLASSVSSAVSGRHLMVWSKNHTNQAAWTVSGVSGTLQPSSVDVSLINISGNKLDQFIRIHVAVSTRRSGSDTAVTMTTTIANTTPPGQSQYIAGPFPDNPAPYGSYGGMVALNLPARASRMTLTGAGPLAIRSGEGPTWLVAAPITIDDGATSTVQTRFVLPGSHGSMTLVPSARIPPEQWTAGGRTFDDSVPVTISW
jgi:hypothetical protein